jgi:adhesin transport system outer membrane protein
VEAPIWAGGRLSANIQRAEALEESTSAQYIETVQNLALTTSQTYFEIARLTLREQLLQDSLAEHNRLVGTMERRVEQEVSPLADLELARSRSAQIEQEYTSTTAQRLTALRVLAQLVADPDYDLGASLRIQATIENTRVAEQELRRSVASDIITYEASKKQATISTSAASTASRVSESYMRQFIAGRRSWLDVMNALREAVNAQIAKSDAQIITMSTASKLLLQSGRWRPVFDEPVKK